MANTDWNINTDIYGIVESIQNVEKRYIEDENETTLALGIFGFVADTEAKKIQTSTIMAGQLGNEMFPTRANLTKNVLTHAAYTGISDFNATPASITVTIGIKEEDIDKYVDEVTGEFFLDSYAPIYIGSYEFHLQYDVKIIRKRNSDNTYGYSAQYVMEDEEGISLINNLSDIHNPYLNQPFIVKIANKNHVCIQVTLKQVTIEEINDRMVSDSIIENKSYTFEFDNQMADFMVEVIDNGVRRVITPYLYGSRPKNDDVYCWYLYTSDNSIRLTFDSRSFIPGLNSEIYIKSFTTLGAKGNFEYIDVDKSSEGLYVIINCNRYEESKFKYKNLTTYVVAVTDSENGSDRKSKEELQKLIPKAALSKGSITTDTDVSNYFNLINTETNRLVMTKKVDNQLTRTWYGFFLLKDGDNNIIPTNSINLKLVLNDGSMKKCDNGRYILPAGSFIRFDPKTGEGRVINEADIPYFYGDKYFNSGYYYYTTIYNVIINREPLYSSFYLTVQNNRSFFIYTFVNENSSAQFIANRFYFNRNLKIEPDQYKLSFSIAKSTRDSTFSAYSEEVMEVVDSEGNKSIKKFTTQNIRVILVVYKNNIPYRWLECNIDQVNELTAVYDFSATMVTDNEYDDDNNIKIRGMNKVGTNAEMYGYFPENVEAEIYILANITPDPHLEYARQGIDEIAPGYEDYIVTNVYKCKNGLNFFQNYTNIINTKITQNPATNTVYTITNVPCIGAHYLQSDADANYVIEAINERKAYIDYCLALLENSITVDFKFFNTYGQSITYTLEDNSTTIGNIDINLKFKVSLKNATDINTVDNIKQSIKDYIENINEIGGWHAPNLIRDIINSYEDRINFIEFVGFNTFDAGDQHIILQEDEDPNIIPEFINIRNMKDPNTNKLVPCIDIELV